MGFKRMLFVFLVIAFSPFVSLSDNNSISFDGQNQYLYLSDADQFTFQNKQPFSLSAWIYPEKSDVNIISKISNSKFNGWKLDINSKNKLELQITFEQNGNRLIQKYASGKKIEIGKWNHIAFTYNGNGSVYLWVNKEKQLVIGPENLNMLGAGGTALNLGASYYSSHGAELSKYFKGNIDELSIWSKALSDSEIEAITHNSVKTDPDLVAYWKFDNIDDGRYDDETEHNHYFYPVNDPVVEDKYGCVYDMPAGYSLTNAVWNVVQTGSRKALTLTIDYFEGDDFTAFAYDQGSETFVNSNVPGIEKQLERKWLLRNFFITGTSVKFKVPKGIDSSNLVILTARDDKFTDQVKSFGGAWNSATREFEADIFLWSDSVFVTLASANKRTLFDFRASRGWGPFTQTYDVMNTIGIYGYSDELESVLFKTMSPGSIFTGIVLDSTFREINKGEKPEFERQMGDLPIDAGIYSEVNYTDISDWNLIYYKKIDLSPLTPDISATPGFGPYQLGTDTIYQFRITNVASKTTKLTFRIVDKNGEQINFRDDKGNIIFTNHVVEGNKYLYGETWTVQMGDFKFPLSSKLSIKMEHENGVPGGTEYIVPLIIVPESIELTADKGWGPYTGNNYEWTDNKKNPWVNAPEILNNINVSNLPPRTYSVDTFIFDNKDTILSMSGNYTTDWDNYVSEAEFNIKMDSVPLGDYTIQFTAYCEGAEDNGVWANKSIQILPQMPRITASEGFGPFITRSRLDTNDTRVTVNHITLEPSTANSDTVEFYWKQDNGEYFDTIKVPVVYNEDSETRLAKFDYDMLSMNSRVKQLETRSHYTDQKKRHLDTNFDFIIYPAKPFVESSHGWDGFQKNVEFFNYFTVNGLPEEIEKVDIYLLNSNQDTIVIEDYYINSPPYSHTVEFDTTESYIETNLQTSCPDAVSYMIWFRTISQKGGALLSFMKNDGTTDRQLFMDREGKLNFTFDNTGVKSEIRTENFYNDGNWHHAAAVYDNGELSIFVDGLMAASHKRVHKAIPDSGKWVICYMNNAEWNDSLDIHHFEGEISETSIWPDRALDYEDVGRLMHADNFNESESGTFYYYKFKRRFNIKVFDENGLNEGRFTSTYHRKYLPQFMKFVWGVNTGVIDGFTANDGNNELYTRLYYTNGPEEGVLYDIDPFKMIDVSGKTLGGAPSASLENIYVKTNTGWGWFDPGISLINKVTVTTDYAMPENVNELISMHTRFHMSSAYHGTEFDSTVTFNSPASFNIPVMGEINMGYANPGSKILISIAYRYKKQGDNNIILDSAWIEVPLHINAIKQPLVKGWQQTFMQRLLYFRPHYWRTLDIYTDMDLVSAIHIKFGTPWGDIEDTKATANKVSDGHWQFSYDYSILSAGQIPMYIDYYLSNSSKPELSTKYTITVKKRRPQWLETANWYFPFDSIRQDGDKLYFFGTKNTWDVGFYHDVQYRLQDIIYLPITGFDCSISDPRFSASFVYSIEEQKLEFIDPPRIDFHLGYAGGNLAQYFDPSRNHFEYNDETEHEHKNHYAIDENNELIAYQFHEEEHELSITVPIDFAIAAIEYIVEGGINPIGIVPGLEFESAYIYNFLSNTGMKDGKWQVLGDKDIISDENPASHQYLSIAAGGSVGIEVTVLLGLISAGVDIGMYGHTAIGEEHDSYSCDSLRENAFTSSFNVVFKAFFGIIKANIYNHPLWNLHWGDDLPLWWPKPGGGWFISGTEKAGEDEVLGMNSLSSGVLQPYTDVFPQPVLAYNNDHLGSLWLEQDAKTGSASLLFSEFDTETRKFAKPALIASNSNGMSDLHFDILAQRFAVITWSQNRYSAETAPHDAKIEDLIKSQDIWYAVYDLTKDELIISGPVPDDMTEINSGRMENNSNITALNDNKAVLTWTVADTEQNESDLYYSILSFEDEKWILSEPAIVGINTGIDKDVCIGRISDTRAMAAWLNYNEGNSVYEINYSIFNDNSWNPVKKLNLPGYNISGMDLDFESDYGTLVCVGTDTDTKHQSMKVFRWNSNTLDWDINELYSIEDSSCIMRKPRVAINNGGYLGASYQKDNSNYMSSYRNSEVNLITGNLNINPNEWIHHEANEFVCDTLTIVRDIDIAFGDDNLLFLMSQDHDYIHHNIQEPKFGVLFGKPDMDNVLRVILVKDDLSIQDIDENDIVVSVNERFENTSRIDVRNYPNPASLTTTVTFTLPETSETKLEILDMTGRLISTAMDKMLSAGEHSVEINTSEFNSGTYYYRLNSCGESVIKPITVVK